MKKTFFVTASALGLILSAPAFAQDDNDNVSILPILSNVAQDESIANSGVLTDDVLSNNDVLSHNDVLSNNDLLSNNKVNLKLTVAATTLNGTVTGAPVTAGAGGAGGPGVGVGVGALLGLGVGVGDGGDGGDGGDITSTTTNTLSDSVLSGSSGIYNVAQMGGINALAQQGVTVQANLALSGGGYK